MIDTMDARHKHWYSQPKPMGLGALVLSFLLYVGLGCCDPKGSLMTSRAGESSATPDQRRLLLLAKLFDLRTFIGALFLIFGVVVTIEGFVASPAAIAKAAGVNLSLWTGLAMLVVGLIFLAWMLAKPPELDLSQHEDMSQPPGHH